MMENTIGEKIEKAMELRHIWHTDGMQDGNLINEIDFLLGTNFSNSIFEINEEYVADHIEIWIDNHRDSCDLSDCEMCKDIESLTEKELFNKYGNEIKEDAFAFDDGYEGRSRRYEELNERIREFLISEYRKLPENDTAKRKIFEKRKDFAKYREEKVLEEMIEKGEIEYDEVLKEAI